MKTADKTVPALIAAIVCYTLWGFSFLFTRMGLSTGTTPFVLLAYRFLTAFLVMTPVLLLTGKFPKYRSHSRRDLRLLLLQGSVQSFIYFTFETYGLRYTGTTFSGVMVSLIPISALLIAAFLLKEKPNGKQVFAALLSLAGVIVLTLQQKNEGIVTPLGAIFMTVAVLLGGLGNTFSRLLASRFSAIERTYTGFALGSIGCGILAVCNAGGDLRSLIAPLSEPKFLLAIAFLGAFCSVVAYWCQNYASNYLPVARISSFNNLSTVISLLAGVLILSEPFTLLMLPCVVIILLGVWGVQHFADR